MKIFKRTFLVLIVIGFVTTAYISFYKTFKELLPHASIWILLLITAVFLPLAVVIFNFLIKFSSNFIIWLAK